MLVRHESGAGDVAAAAPGGLWHACDTVSVPTVALVLFGGTVKLGVLLFIRPLIA